MFDFSCSVSYNNINKFIFMNCVENFKEFKMWFVKNLKDENNFLMKVCFVKKISQRSKRGRDYGK